MIHRASCVVPHYSSVARCWVLRIADFTTGCGFPTAVSYSTVTRPRKEPQQHKMRATRHSTSTGTGTSTAWIEWLPAMTLVTLPCLTTWIVWIRVDKIRLIRLGRYHGVCGEGLFMVEVECRSLEGHTCRSCSGVAGAPELELMQRP